MLTIAPDFARRIDLPGAGACPRPVDADQAKTGFTKLVSLRIYSFADEVVIDGEAENDEVFIVLVRGRADIGVSSGGRRIARFALDANNGLRAIYLPPHAAYQLTARGDCDVAYARVKPVGLALPDARGFAPVEGRIDIAAYATGMDLAFATVRAGETVAQTNRADGLPERFVHLRYADDGVATASGQQLDDWTTIALADGEAAQLEIDQGTADILTISATAH